MRSALPVKRVILYVFWFLKASVSVTYRYGVGQIKIPNRSTVTQIIPAITTAAVLRLISYLPLVGPRPDGDGDSGGWFPPKTAFRTTGPIPRRALRKGPPGHLPAPKIGPTIRGRRRTETQESPSRTRALVVFLGPIRSGAQLFSDMNHQANEERRTQP